MMGLREFLKSIPTGPNGRVLSPYSEGIIYEYEDRLLDQIAGLRESNAIFEKNSEGAMIEYEGRLAALSEVASLRRALGAIADRARNALATQEPRDP